MTVGPVNGGQRGTEKLPWSSKDKTMVKSKYKVKSFCTTSQDSLDKDINNWICGVDTEIINVSYSVLQSQSTNWYYHAMITYKTSYDCTCDQE